MANLRPPPCQTSPSRIIFHLASQQKGPPSHSLVGEGERALARSGLVLFQHVACRIRGKRQRSENNLVTFLEDQYLPGFEAFGRTAWTAPDGMACAGMVA